MNARANDCRRGPALRSSPVTPKAASESRQRAYPAKPTASRPTFHLPKGLASTCANAPFWSAAAAPPRAMSSARTPMRMYTTPRAVRPARAIQFIDRLSAACSAASETTAADLPAAPRLMPSPYAGTRSCHGVGDVPGRRPRDVCEHA